MMSEPSMVSTRLIGRPVSSRMASTPKAARRSAKGSEEPVGAWPTANRPQMVSILSESATTWPMMSVRNGSSPEKRGR